MISTVTTTTTTMTTEIMSIGVIAVVALILLLALKEILSSETGKNRQINRFVQSSNVGIVPLLLVFASIVTYKVVTIL
ncbi:MAG: hypothetical protein BME94_00295 [Methanobacteriales archaeon Met13]